MSGKAGLGRFRWLAILLFLYMANNVYLMLVQKQYIPGLLPYASFLPVPVELSRDESVIKLQNLEKRPLISVRAYEGMMAKAWDPYEFQPAGRFALFYNIYVAPDAEAKTKRIIEEQLREFGSSSVVSNGPVDLYYNTFGTPLNEAYMKGVCKKSSLNCHLMQHRDVGFEDMTLQRLHEYCVQNTDSNVFYFHSKGSFHDLDDPNYSQKSWRWHMTKVGSLVDDHRLTRISNTFFGVAYISIIFSIASFDISLFFPPGHLQRHVRQ
jgi:hypothetical protein